MNCRRVAAAVAAMGIAASVAAPAGAAAEGGHISISPGHGPVGTLITLAGHLNRSDRRDLAAADTVTLYTAGHPHAGLETSVAGNLTIRPDGAMRLSFTLPLYADGKPIP